jgi:hypothetical protein
VIKDLLLFEYHHIEGDNDVEPHLYKPELLIDYSECEEMCFLPCPACIESQEPQSEDEQDQVG